MSYKEIHANGYGSTLGNSTRYVPLDFITKLMCRVAADGMTRSPPTTRRTILRNGAIASSLALGGTTLSGVGAARRPGGAAFISVDDFNKALDDDQTFKIVEADDWSLEHSAGCSGRENAPTEEYTGYLILFEEGIFDYCCDTLGHLYVEPNRNVETDIWQDVASTRPCPPTATATNPFGTEYDQEVLKIAFKPHTE